MISVIKTTPFVYITLHYIINYLTFIVAKVINCKVHYGASHTTMSAYDCRNKCVFSFRRNDNSDVAVVTSRGRVLGNIKVDKRTHRLEQLAVGSIITQDMTIGTLQTWAQAQLNSHQLVLKV